VAISATHVIPERVCARAHVHARADVRVCASAGVSECMSVCAHLHPLQKLWHDSPAKVVTVLPKKEFEGRCEQQVIAHMREHEQCRETQHVVSGER
jgi:hypothetical protein